MKPIVIPRMPWMVYVLVACAIMGQVAMCYPAATARGYPPIHPFWMKLAPVTCIALPLLFAFFDDSQKTLRVARILFVLPATLMLAAIICNVSSGRPSIGHLAGLSGLFVSGGLFIVLTAVPYSILVFAVVIGLERWGGLLWARVRGFSEKSEDGPRLRLSLAAFVGIVTILAALFAVAAAAPRIYDQWPGAHWHYRCRTNLRQLGIAVHNYANEFGTFPPAFVADAEGRPMHSWRVLILPYLEDDAASALYERYDFDEPWNGVNNRELLAEMPPVFRCPWDDSESAFDASYLAITGDGTAFPPHQTVAFRDFRDGSSSSLMLLEVVRSGIPWTAPRDFDASAILADSAEPDSVRLSFGHMEGGAHVEFADGHVRWLEDGMSTDTMRAILTIDGGEPLPWEH